MGLAAAPLTGGHFEGPRLRGTVLPGGSADWLLLRADGVLEMDLRATLRTDDGALISMTIVRLASRSARRDRGHRAWRDGRSGNLLLSDDAAVRDRAPRYAF